MNLHLSVHKDDPKVEKIKKGWEEKNSKVFTNKSAPFVIEALKKLRFCKDCQITFETKALRTKHMEELHPNKKNIPDSNQNNKSSNQDNSSTVNSKTILFRPSETMKNVYSKKFVPRTITLKEGEKIIVQNYNDKMKIDASNLVFKGALLSNQHATFSLYENVLYLQDHSTNNTSITPVNGVSMNIDHGKSVVVNSFDTINFGSCPVQGVITEVEFLSDYEVKRLSNIEEKNQQIPPKVSSIIPPKPKRKKSIIKTDESKETPQKTVITRQELKTQKKSESELNRKILTECPECAERFEADGALLLHMEIMHPDFNLQSFQDRLILEKESNITSHSVAQGNEKMFMPSSEFASADSPYDCNICFDQFETFEQLEKHTKDNHSVQEPRGSISNSSDDLDINMNSDNESSFAGRSRQLPNTLEISRSEDSDSEMDFNENETNFDLENNSEQENTINHDSEKIRSRNEKLINFLEEVVFLLNEKKTWLEIETIFETMPFEEWEWKRYLNPQKFNSERMYIDSNASELYKSGGKIDKIPVYVESDGSTLFSSMSVLLCGEEYLATEIRASTVAAMIKNRPAITDAARSKGLHLNTEINYEKNLFNVASFDPLQTTLHYIAMTWAIKIASILVYPQVGCGFTNMEALSSQGLFGGSLFPFNGHFIMKTGVKNENGYDLTDYVPLLQAEEREIANLLTTIEEKEVLQEDKDQPETNIRFSNFARRITRHEYFLKLASIKEVSLPEKVPSGNKTNLTFFVKRTNFAFGPGALVDDKSPYNGKYGATCYGYKVENGIFKKQHSGYLTTKDMRFTYMFENVPTPCPDDWIIVWSYQSTRDFEGNQLKRHSTYFITKNSEYLWLNQIALVEYIGVDTDLVSNELPHGNSLREGSAFARTGKDIIAESLHYSEFGAKPRKTFTQLRNLEEPTKGLFNSKQIYNAISRSKAKKLGQGFGNGGSEEMLTAFRHMQLKTESYGKFIKHFSVEQAGKPTLILFEDWQIQYTKKMCRFHPARCSNIQEDKTYSVSKCFLTYYCFPTLDFVVRSKPNVHPVIPGPFFYHGDSLGDSFDTYHEKLATYLKIDNKPHKYTYIMLTDGEKAIINSKKKFFPEALHIQCQGHLCDNFQNRCQYPKTTNKYKDMYDLVCTQMAGADTMPEFFRLKDFVIKKYPDAFLGDYFEYFCDTMQHYVVEPRLAAPLVVPKWMKTNAIEACNSKVKYYMDHQPHSIPESGLRLKELVDDVKGTIIQALYDEGDWMVAPGSNIKLISKKAWERKSKQQQDKLFMRLICGVDTDTDETVQRPQKQDLSDVKDPKEKRLINRQHKVSLARYNEEKKKQQYSEFQETGIPPLNITGQIKKKKNQKNRPTANTTNKRYTK